jgi:hypothetical protein
MINAILWQDVSFCSVRSVCCARYDNKNYGFCMFYPHHSFILVAVPLTKWPQVDVIICKERSVQFLYCIISG